MTAAKHAGMRFVVTAEQTVSIWDEVRDMKIGERTQTHVKTFGPQDKLADLHKWLSPLDADQPKDARLKVTIAVDGERWAMLNGFKQLTDWYAQP